MDGRRRGLPVARGADPLEEVLRGIQAELKRQNQLAQAGDEDAAAKAARLAQQHAELAGTRSGSRFAAPGAAEDVLDTLAAGGSIQEPRGWHGTGGRMEPRGQGQHGAHGGREREGLAVIFTKALALGTPSAGGVLVPPELHDEVVGLLRARAAVLGMPVRYPVPVTKALEIPYLSSGASAYWVAENAAIPVSEQTFDARALLAPRDLTALVPVSDRLLRDSRTSGRAVDEIVEGDLAEVLALRADLAFLHGTGAAGEPVGITQTAGTTPGPALGGAAVTFDDLKDAVAALRAINAPFRTPGWVFNAQLLAGLEKVKTTTGEYLANAGLLEFSSSGASGTLLGFAFRTTSQADPTRIVFSSDWNELWVGEEQRLTIEASNEASYWDGSQWVSAWQNRMHVFRAVWTIDVGLRRPELFSVMTGVGGGA
jgi:HK97 family phage major capsid protein